MTNYFSQSLTRDLISGLIVFLVALPLCLGIALASNAPLFSGILGGIVGGIVVGMLSGSSISVSGPAAGLTAIVATELQTLGSFEAFLMATIIAGIIQILFSAFKMGFLAGFFPSSVIKGLLWAIGLILILKQFPHLLGHDKDPMGDDSFLQIDNQNTFSELLETVFDFHYGAAIIGIFSLTLLLMFDRIKILKKSSIAAPLFVVVLSIIMSTFFSSYGNEWDLFPHHLVQVPVAQSLKDTFNFLMFPDFQALKNFAVFTSAITIALVASLETLLNLEALDKIDPLQRINPSNRELFAQGVGNIVGGFIGALPITSVIIRSSVNINAGAITKFSTIFHGILLCTSVVLVPDWLNRIPLSALAAILITTGFKLASPKILLQLWKEGKYQFLPFIITVTAILLTDLLIGILIGLGIAICFILHSNIRQPIKKVMEKHATGHEVLHIELPNQVSFFNRVALENTLRNIPRGGHVLIDAINADYIDPDILDLINDFQKTASAHLVNVSLTGFKEKYPKLVDCTHYVDFTSRELQKNINPQKILEILQEGNNRFRKGIRLTRNLERQLNVASVGQFPMAVVLSCIDSRAPVELLFDLSIGDIFTVRIAGNVVSHKVIGSIEYASAIAGAKLVVVMGHTSCGAVKASVDFFTKDKTAAELTGCDNLDSLIAEIQKSIDLKEIKNFQSSSSNEKEDYLNKLTYKNVLHSIKQIRTDSPILKELELEKKISIVGAIYNVSNGEVTFFSVPQS
jgi:carbonic anhydrase/SulP family sulfate permease